MFQAGAWLISQYYALTHSYGFAIALVAVSVMVLMLPLTLKSTKGMLEMQRLQPELRRLQAQHRGDRQKLNEEMMKLYQEHKVNPLASCLPMLLQMPVFIVMFRVLHKLTEKGEDGTFDPSYISKSSELFQSLDGRTEMKSFFLDLAKSPAEMVGDRPGVGLIYVLLVVCLAGLYFVQQRMVAARATMSPSMSAGQQKLLQYLPVAFAAFQLFFPTGLIIYYLTQTFFRIGQQYYITHRFYKGDHSLGRQAQAASQKAREIAKENGGEGGGGVFAQAKREAVAARDAKSKTSAAVTPPVANKRVTPPKSRPTPSGRVQRPQGSNRPGNAPSRPKKKS